MVLRLSDLILDISLSSLVILLALADISFNLANCLGVNLDFLSVQLGQNLMVELLKEAERE